MPEWIQPYLCIGIGSGIAEQTPAGSAVLGSREPERILGSVRGWQSELMVTKNWGALMDVSYYASTSGALEGITTFRLGGIFRF